MMNYSALSKARLELPTSKGDVFVLDWGTWTPEARCVLTVILTDNKVLLIEKKRGFGAGKVSVPGGHIEPGESAHTAAVRESVEEVGLVPHSPRHVGDLGFAFTSGFNMAVAVFLAESHSGRMTETDEAAPFWQSLDAIPYQRMWADDRIWLPHVLGGGTFKGDFVFEADTGLNLWHQMRVS